MSEIQSNYQVIFQSPTQESDAQNIRQKELLRAIPEKEWVCLRRAAPHLLNKFVNNFQCCHKNIRRLLDKNISFHKQCAYMIIVQTGTPYISCFMCNSF